jgi:spermidine/putrescine transport system substrate-binding protein
MNKKRRNQPDGRPLSRREFIRIAGLGAVGLAATQCAPLPAPSAPPAPTSAPAAAAPSTAASAAAPAGKVGGQLNIMTWQGYDDPKAFKPLYDQYGIVPNSTYIGSNDEVLTKYQAGGAGAYDVGDINSRYIKPMVEQNMLMALDESRLPNLADLYPAFKDIDPGRVNGKLYALPGFFGFDVITYNADKVPEPTSWDFYKQDPYKGHYAFYDNSAGQLLLWGLITGVGTDATKWTADDLAKVKALGMDIHKNAATVSKSYGDCKDMLVRGDITSVFYSWEAVAVWGQQEHVNLKNTRPAGPGKAWIDCYFIFNGAKNPDTAYAWLNYAISPTCMSIMGPGVSSLVSNSKAAGLMDPTVAQAMGYDGINDRIKSAVLTVMPNKEAQAPYISLDDFSKAYDEIMAG